MPKLRRRGRRDEGQIIVLFALVVVVILAFTALVVDIGLLRNSRQNLANAFDAGALAGGTLLPVDGSVAGSYTAIDALVRQQVNATYPGGLPNSAYKIEYRCLIGVNNGLPYISRDIPAVCDPHHALGHNPPVVTDFIGAGSTRSSVCRPDLGDRCNIVVVSGALTQAFSFGRTVGVNQGSTGTVTSAACNGPCGQPPFAPLDVVVIIDRTSSMSGDEANLRNAARTVLSSYDPAVQHVALAMLGPSTLNATCSGSPAGVHGLPLDVQPQPQQQPPSFEQDTSSNNASAGATTLVITRPSNNGNINGQFLIAGITVHGGTATAVTTPNGWTLLRRTDNAGNISVLSYYRWAGTTEPNTYTWTFGASVRAAGGIMRYTNVNTTTPIDASSGNSGNGGTQNNLSASQVTTTVDQTALVTFHATDTGTTISPANSGMNEQFDVRNSNSTGPSIEGSEDTDGNPGQTGNKNHDAGSAAQWVAQLIALRPAPVANVVQEYGTNTTTDMSKWVVVGLTGTGGAPVNEAYSTNGVVNNNSQIGKAISCFDLSSTGTNLSTPLDMARVYLQNNGRGANVKQGIILETDGAPNYNGTSDPANYTCAAARAAADRAKAANIEIFTIGFGVENENCPDGGGSAVNLLGSLATGPILGGGSSCSSNGAENRDGDHFFCQPTGTDLSAVFQAAAVQLAGIRSHLVQIYPAPYVANIAPASGTRAGGTTVTITGSNFTGATSVTFGGQPAISFVVVNDTTITARAPAGTAGQTVDVRVSTQGGTSPKVSGDRYTYN